LVKRELILRGIFQGPLEAEDIVTYEDKIKYRIPLYHCQILFNQGGHDRIGELIARNKPLLVSRLGAFELSCLQFYLERRVKRKKNYSQNLRFAMSNNAGFFPAENKNLDAFSELYLQELTQVDVMGVWFNYYENIICNNYCRTAELVELDSLDPFNFNNPWSAKLAGLKVLVVHPFAESIQKQYTDKRRLLFADPGVLPDFELRTIKAVQSIAGSQVNFATWFDAYRHMCDEMALVDFDICIIGAGAYGLPLASFAKKMGKRAIHMGGVTQILFGIKGNRWEKDYADTTAKLFNEHWVRPMASETPVNKDMIEKGCYW
jgi:hypothetical protein